MNITLPIASYWHQYLHPELARLAQPVQGWFYTVSPNGELSINLVALILVGVLTGLLAGSFGVGSGFLMTPFLNIVGNIPFNVAIGSDLTHMVGSATQANLRQRALGYVDYKLGLLLFAGSVVGVEIGVQLLQLLKRGGEVSFIRPSRGGDAARHDPGVRPVAGLDRHHDLSGDQGGSPGGDRDPGYGRAHGDAGLPAANP
jgi:hypothetical protein